MNPLIKSIPEFLNHEEEVAFWEQNDACDYFDFSKSIRVDKVAMSNLSLTSLLVAGHSD